MNKEKIIIDCDPGIDDTLALMYAIQHPKLEVVAITITAGNSPVELGLKNTFVTLELLNRHDIPVYVGDNLPLQREFISAQDTHGMDGLGENNFTLAQPIIFQEESADCFLANYFEHKNDTSIIALGPLTNIARALQTNPKLGKHCKRFISMGGSFKSHGNCSPVAEYNYWCDPHAAQYVFENLDKKIEMVGLDITRHIVLTPNHLSYMERINPDVSSFIQKITKFYFDFHWQYEHIIGCVINDPLAIAYFVNENIATGFDRYTDVACHGIAMGQTIVDQYHFYKKDANSKILTSVNTNLFWNDFMTVLLHAQNSVIIEDLEMLGLNK
ncbi:TPA: nucleoside hydrolase [Streptococcus agalactiae]